MILPDPVHPPLFIESHGGGRCYAMRFARGRYDDEKRVFGGIDEPQNTDFSPGPAMRYAKVDPRLVRVYHDGHRLGTWRVPGAKVVAWWDLPIVVRGDRVDLLRPGGRLRRLPLGGGGLVTVLPGRSGALFALYSTKTHWRVLRRGRDGDRWTPWLAGSATGFAPTPDRLFVAAGDPANAYGTDFGYNAALWSYAFRDGATARVLTCPARTSLVLDGPWVRRDHLLSSLRHPRPTNRRETWSPDHTSVFRLSDRPVSLGTLPSGWDIYAHNPATHEFLALHDNRGEMGYDLRWVQAGTSRERKVDECVDALDVSTRPSYSPLVDDAPRIARSTSVAGYRLAWEGPSEDETLRLLDRRGRVVTTIRDFHARPVEQDGKVQVTRVQGVPTIVLNAWTGGAHGGDAYFVWALGRRPRCLLAYDKNNVADEHDFDLADLDGDGVPEVRSWYDGFAYTVRVSFWPDLPVVLRLEHGRYVDRTARYGSILDRAEHDQWSALLASDRRAPPRAWSDTLGAGVNLVALAELRGTQRRTWTRLRTLVRPDSFAWLKRREAAIAATPTRSPTTARPGATPRSRRTSRRRASERDKGGSSPLRPLPRAQRPEALVVPAMAPQDVRPTLRIPAPYVHAAAW